MKKLIKIIAVAFILLVVTFTLTPTTAYADVELLSKDKTNKLTLGDTMEECFKGIEESLAAGDSITYKINVPKGVLYIRIADYTDFKVEIYDSKNKVVKTMESVKNVLYGDIALASGGVELSKGNYKIKISPKDKNSELKSSGIVTMVKTDTTRTVSVNKQYNIAVKKGKTYKLKFTIKAANSESRLSVYNVIQSYDPNEVIPYIQESTVVNSKGKTVKKFDSTSNIKAIKEKGTYTLVIKAKETGILTTEVEFEENKVGVIDIN